MARKSNRSIEEIEKEILTYTNVPVPLAAEYLGWDPMGLRLALRDGDVDFGSARRPTGRKYVYWISPFKLIHHQGRDKQFEQEEAVLGFA